MRDDHRRATADDTPWALRVACTMGLALTLARPGPATPEMRSILIAPGPGSDRPPDGFGAGEYVVAATDDIILPAVVQLLISEGPDTECWQTTYARAGTNVSTLFKARGP